MDKVPSDGLMIDPGCVLVMLREEYEHAGGAVGVTIYWFPDGKKIHVPERDEDPDGGLDK